jgi:hypothetical protein
MPAGQPPREDMLHLLSMINPRVYGVEQPPVVSTNYELTAILREATFVVQPDAPQQSVAHARAAVISGPAAHDIRVAPPLCRRASLTHEAKEILIPVTLS